jgi:hypothetical protein
MYRHTVFIVYKDDRSIGISLLRHIFSLLHIQNTLRHIPILRRPPNQFFMSDQQPRASMSGTTSISRKKRRAVTESTDVNVSGNTGMATIKNGTREDIKVVKKVRHMLQSVSDASSDVLDNCTITTDGNDFHDGSKHHTDTHTVDSSTVSLQESNIKAEHEVSSTETALSVINVDRAVVTTKRTIRRKDARHGPPQPPTTFPTLRGDMDARLNYNNSLQSNYGLYAGNGRRNKFGVWYADLILGGQAYGVNLEKKKEIVNGQPTFRFVHTTNANVSERSVRVVGPFQHVFSEAIYGPRVPTQQTKLNYPDANTDPFMSKMNIVFHANRVWQPYDVQAAARGETTDQQAHVIWLWQIRHFVAQYLFDDPEALVTVKREARTKFADSNSLPNYFESEDAFVLYEIENSHVQSAVKDWTPKKVSVDTTDQHPVASTQSVGPVWTIPNPTAVSSNTVQMLKCESYMYRPSIDTKRQLKTLSALPPEYHGPGEGPQKMRSEYYDLRRERILVRTRNTKNALPYDMHTMPRLERNCIAAPVYELQLSPCSAISPYRINLKIVSIIVLMNLPRDTQEDHEARGVMDVSASFLPSMDDDDEYDNSQSDDDDEQPGPNADCTLVKQIQLN